MASPGQRGRHQCPDRVECESDKRDELEEEQRSFGGAARIRKPLEFGGKDDFQLAQAIKHFKGLPVQLAKGDVDADKAAVAVPATEKKPSETAPPELKGAKKK